MNFTHIPHFLRLGISFSVARHHVNCPRTLFYHLSGSLCHLSSRCLQCLLIFLPATSFIFCSFFPEVPLCLCIMLSFGSSCLIFNLWVVLRCPHSFLLPFLLVFLPTVFMGTHWDWGGWKKKCARTECYFSHHCCVKHPGERLADAQPVHWFSVEMHFFSLVDQTCLVVFS